MPSSEVWEGMPGLAIFKGKLEDRFTHYLSELLLSKKALSSFLQDICLLSPSSADISAAYVNTWHEVPGGFPDLVIDLPRDLLIIEVKVDSPLNQWQISTYARYLMDACSNRDSTTGHLLLLTPAYSAPQSIVEATSQANSANFTSPIRAITWEAVAKWCAALARSIENDDPRFATYLHDFCTTITAHLGQPPRALNTTESEMLATKDAGSALAEVCSLLPKVAIALEESNLAVKPYSHLSEFQNICFGFEIARGEDRFWLLI